MITAKDLYDEFQKCSVNEETSLLPKLRNAVQAYGIEPEAILPSTDAVGLNHIQVALAVLCDHNLAMALMSASDQQTLYAMLEAAAYRWNQIHSTSRSRTQRLITDTLITGNGWSPI